MHWFNWIMVALLYALVGTFIGAMYAFITGANMSSFGDVFSWGVIFGPIVLMMIMAMRKLMRERGGIPIARAIYHTLLITFAAPVFLYAAQRIAIAASEPEVARWFEVMKYWSIPSVFIVAVMYGIWRVMEGNRPRAVGTSGGAGGAPPSGTGGDPFDSPSARSGQALKVAATPTQGSSSDSLPRDAQGHRYVACFSSRGTPFRLVRIPD